MKRSERGRKPIYWVVKIAPKNKAGEAKRERINRLVEAEAQV